MSKSTLGRGLNSLIPPKGGTRQGAGSGSHERRIEEIAVNSIQPNSHQPREHFDHDSLEDLINSIKVHGIIQPLIVLADRGGYQLVAGERRLRAAKVIGLQRVPAIIRTATDQEKLELAIVENVQRENLNPIEKARGFARLMEEFSLTQDEVGKKVGQSRTAVANAIRLLSLPPVMQRALQEGQITEGHAKVLLGVRLETERERIFKDIVRNRLSVRATESDVRQTVVRSHRRRHAADPNRADLQQRLQEALGTRVELTGDNKRGTVVIQYYSQDELRTVVKKITSAP